MDYVNLAAIVWLTFMIISTAVQLNNNIGRRVQGFNVLPFLVSIVALATLGFHLIGEIIS